MSKQGQIETCSTTPSSPIPNEHENMEDSYKRKCVVTELNETQLNEIVDILGEVLLMVKNDVFNKKDNYTPSTAAKLLLGCMDVNTSQDKSQHLYCLMTGFMTVYVCFIQVLLQSEFDRFMRLFNQHDSLLESNSQPFLWYYFTNQNNQQILRDINRLLLIDRKLEPVIILQHIDTIFSKFYTFYFLESSAQKHQKEHGQFYTPPTVLQFMWDKCATVPYLVNHLENNPTIPRIFDPCLGIGSFLCEFLSRFTKALRFTSLWNNSDRLLSILTTQIPDQVWGIEIDPFAYQLCKLNMMVHMFPLYERLVQLNKIPEPSSIHRLKLFCNDTLKLRVDTNPFFDPTCVNNIDHFEQSSLDLLRDPTKLKFDFIVTNPPYMIRKTGYITQPDPVIYDETKLGGRGTQAYLYFMWIALQRCDDIHGQVCLITPSQWTVLEFAQHIREWIWKNCNLLDMYEFEPYKIWPKVQTDSLVFRVCKRTTTLPNTNRILYMRHLSRKIALNDLLAIYQRYEPNHPPHDDELKYKYTLLTDTNRVLTTKHASFAFILPTASCVEELNAITAHLPRLCDGELYKTETASPYVPLIWNRGPNTNPVYSLVVRTTWAIETFGQAACNRWLRPCFYWNGKTISSATGGGKEGQFWKERDALRLNKKETSAAEAYWPYCNIDIQHPTVPFYSMILVNKEDADKLKHQYSAEGEESEIGPLYRYLMDARLALQADKTEKEVAHCQYNKCGIDVPVKIVHPINCGYYTRSQPRQRFFVDKTDIAVTNQCIYFTIKPNYPCQDSDYFCGVLNSILIQFFTKVHCGYDQQGRMRFFGRSMAYIPFAPHTNEIFTQQMATFVQGVTLARTWIYSFIRYTEGGSKLMERVRNCEWHLSPVELEILSQFNPPQHWHTIQPDTSLSRLLSPHQLQWITEFVKEQELTVERTEHVFIVLLKIASLFQLCIDRMVYYIYQVPGNLQLDIEKDLHLKGIRKQWQSANVDKEANYVDQDPEAWFSRIISIALSFKTDYSKEYILTYNSTGHATTVSNDSSASPEEMVAANHIDYE